MLPLKEKVNPNHTALVVVDVQNDFCHSKGALGLRDMDMSHIQLMVPRLIQFIDAARANGVPIIYVRTSHGHWTDSEAWMERRKEATVNEIPICSEGSWGAEFYDFAPLPSDKIVVKHRYSGFYGTDLEVVLRARNIKTVLMTGVATDVCVDTTAKDAAQRNFHVVVVDDCCATTSPEDHQAALRHFCRHFGVVATSQEIQQGWSN